MLRRTPLTRKTPLKPGGYLNRTKPMNKVSTTKRAKARTAKERFADSRGVCFDEIRLHLPDKVIQWPKARRIVDTRLRGQYRWMAKTCALCRRVDALDPPT